MARPVSKMFVQSYAGAREAVREVLGRIGRLDSRDDAGEVEGWREVAAIAEARVAVLSGPTKAVNGDRVPPHACAAGPADPSCCATCGRPIRRSFRYVSRDGVSWEPEASVKDPASYAYHKVENVRVLP